MAKDAYFDTRHLFLRKPPYDVFQQNAIQHGIYVEVIFLLNWKSTALQVGNTP